MKKQILFSIFFSLASFIGFTQSLTVTHAEDSVVGNVDSVFENHIIIKNIGLSAVEVGVERTINNLSIDHLSYFCWVNCYDPNTSVSPDYQTINAGDTTDAFKGYLEHSGSPGTSEVQYCFYEKNNTSNKVCHKVIYSVADINSAIKYTTTSIASIYPSIAAETIHVNLINNNTIVRYKIYNQVGQILSNGILNSAIDINNLYSGMYILEIEQGVNVQHIRFLKP